MIHPGPPRKRAVARAGHQGYAPPQAASGPNDGVDLDPEVRMILTAQQEMEYAIVKGGLTDDPLRHPIAAFSLALGSHLELHRNTRKIMQETLDRAEALHDPTRPLGYKVAVVISRELHRLSSSFRFGAARVIGCLFAACVIFSAGLVSNASLVAGQEANATAAAFNSAAGGHSGQWLNFIQQNSWDAVVIACSKAPPAFVTSDGRHACNAPVYLDAGSLEHQIDRSSAPKL